MAPPRGPQRLRVTAPAKLNLGLRVLGTRADGYHLIESLFVPLDLVDDVDLEVEPGAGDEADIALTLRADADFAGPPLQGVPTDHRNLAVRAAARFLAATGLDARVAIRLTKRIPAAAGLGGGSSDAGAVLRGLASLFPGSLDDAALRGLALELGADVPFFLDPRASVVSGIGETVEPQKGLPSLTALLVNSGDSLDTAEVYAAYDALAPALTPRTPGSTMRAISDLRATGEGTGGAGHRAARSSSTPNGESGESSDPRWGTCLRTLLVNDLEPAAIRLCPPVGRLKTQLEEVGALATGMSGSGATVFGIFASGQEAGAARKRIETHSDAWTCVVRTA